MRNERRETGTKKITGRASGVSGRESRPINDRPLRKGPAEWPSWGSRSGDRSYRGKRTVASWQVGKLQGWEEGPRTADGALYMMALK